MAKLHEQQLWMRQALQCGALDDGLVASVEPTGSALEAVIGIHRRTFYESTTKHLRAVFSKVARQLGDQGFRSLTREFIESHPPRTPCLLEYGAELPDSLAAFRPPWVKAFVPDLARVEWAWSRACFSKDAVPLDLHSLAEVAELDLPGLCFIVHPSVHMVESRYRIGDLWAAEGSEAFSGAITEPEEKSTYYLVFRPLSETFVLSVTLGDYVFLNALMGGLTVDIAAAEAIVGDPDFDLQQVLTGHLLRGTFSGFSTS